MDSVISTISLSYVNFYGFGESCNYKFVVVFCHVSSLRLANTTSPVIESASWYGRSGYSMCVTLL